MTIMKKIFLALAVATGLFTATSCEDMLESDSTRQAFEPELNAKTDSVFYAFGIMQAMQQLADQYVFLGEMRGDLVATTQYTDNNLRQLADFSASATNKYDSAYVFYRVINNCNYYIAHRDTTLYTGATNVTLKEYAAVKAIRAWAYLQLGRNYERVPFFTEPLTKISQIDDNTYPRYTLQQMVPLLADDLEPFSGYVVPDYGLRSIEMGSSNSAGSKSAFPDLCFVPVDVVLGELYLEANDYAAAARHFITFLTRKETLGQSNKSYYAEDVVIGGRASMQQGFYNVSTRPSDYDQGNEFKIANKWNQIFGNSSTQDIVTYIPMAVNYVNGVTTSVPRAFGYDYYSTSAELTETSTTARNRRYLDEVQIAPSQSFYDVSDAQSYHYYSVVSGGIPKTTVNSVKWGDMRVLNSVQTYTDGDSTLLWIYKYNRNANILLYRNSTVLLMLAEAYNRMGYPRLAFAILKEGISAYLISDRCTYLTQADKDMLRQQLLAPASLAAFEQTGFCGIHTHGAGETRSFNGSNDILNSPYMPDTIIGLKMKEVAASYTVAVGNTLADSINAMEDLLCDEYALELAWEGRRYYDLMRLANHKNADTLYGANFGSIWMARKLDYKQPTKDLTNKQNWYLPFN